MPDSVPADLRAFVAEEIGSLVQLELLFLLATDPARQWSVEEAAKALYVSTEAAHAFLEAMRARGLFALAPEQGYRFAPEKPERVELIRRLDEFYKERRLTVINLIYAGPVEKYQSFANAFRFKRDK